MANCYPGISATDAFTRGSQCSQTAMFVVPELARVIDGAASANGNDVNLMSPARRPDGDGSRRFDKGGDQFYEQISALHKSVRGSDPDAAFYWFARMMDGGCDLLRGSTMYSLASEDIGLADPRALQLALMPQRCRKDRSPRGSCHCASFGHMACAEEHAVWRSDEASDERGPVLGLIEAAAASAQCDHATNGG